MRESVCIKLPPGSWQKQLLAKGGTLRYVEVSWDDIEFAQLDLTSCATPVAVKLFDTNQAAKYAQRAAQAQHWAALPQPFVYTPGEGCSRWEQGAPASLWGNREQVRERWTQPDSAEWGALTGFYAKFPSTTFFYAKDKDTCAWISEALAEYNR